MNRTYLLLFLGIVVVAIALVLLVSNANTKDAEFDDCSKNVGGEKEACFRNLAVKHKDASICIALSAGSGDSIAEIECYNQVAKSILAESAEKAKGVCDLISSENEREGCYRRLQSMVSG